MKVNVDHKVTKEIEEKLDMEKKEKEVKALLANKEKKEKEDKPDLENKDQLDQEVKEEEEVYKENKEKEVYKENKDFPFKEKREK